MYTKENLMTDLKNMGLKPTDSVMIHSSMKSIGAVEGGADTVLDAGKVSAVTGRVLSHESNCLIDREEIPAEWWRE